MWKTITFETIYSEPSRNGLTRPKSVRGDGYKMVNMGELFANPRIGKIGMELVKMSDKEIASFKLHKGDLLFARQSLVAEGAGKCSIINEIDEITTFESHLIRVRLDLERANPWFYFYYFQSPIGKSKIQSLVNQVSAAGIRGSELSKLEVHYPPILEQHKIAAILSTYDNLIENNNRRITILEEIAQRLYREWFIHFRFPGHENIKMVESELGMIPTGWSCTILGSILSLMYGKSLIKEKRNNGEYPVMGSSGMVDYHNEYLVKGPGIILGRKGNVGSVFLCHKNFYPIDTVYFVDSTKSKYYLYYLIQSQQFINNDAAVPGLNREAALAHKVIIAPDTLISRFCYSYTSTGRNTQNKKYKSS